VRPSELTSITDPLTAFYFDRAVATFGTEVEAAMDEAADGAKNKKESQRRRQMALARYMKDEDGRPSAGTFRDPAAAARQQ
jgi:hypothetical protein